MLKLNVHADTVSIFWVILNLGNRKYNCNFFQFNFVFDSDRDFKQF